MVVYRLKLNMNQTEFAKYLGIGRVAYCKIENGNRQIGLKLLIRIYLKLKERFPDLNMQDLLEM